MRTLQLYIEGERVELFQDEKISITSTIQNLEDITKTYTDVTQTFTVPASTQNNKIFQHFYNSDVDSTIDHNIRRSASIEIDFVPFRKGLISLEKANTKNGLVDNYQITFYGQLLSLKDKFGELKLSDLNYDAYNHVYNVTQILNRVQDANTDYSVRYPLISSKRIWTYNSGSSSDDISQNAGAIEWNELLPAFRVADIFNIIETQFGVTFQSDFLNSVQFSKLYLWYKNKVDTTVNTNGKIIDFTSATANGLYNSVNLTNNTISYHYGTITPYTTPIDGFTWKTYITVSSISNGSVYWYVDIFKGDNLITTVRQYGNGTFLVYQENNANNTSLDTTLSFRMRADVQISCSISMSNALYLNGFTTIPIDEITITCASMTTSDKISLSTCAPDMKLYDFFNGIIKMYNLICEGIDENTYEIEPLDNWYNKGAVIDITPYTDVDSVDINRIKLYKSITFQYAESKCILNDKFYGLFARQFGSVKNTFDYDGSDFNIQLPFENLIQNRFIGTNIQVGFSIDAGQTPYVPNPVLLYLGDEQDTTSYPFKIHDGGIHTINSYAPFGQDAQMFNGISMSLNFGQEISSLYLESNPNSLYYNYYQAYLLNLYNLKNRMYTYKAILPISLITGLKLNDRLVIRDKRYVINDLKLDLITGECMFSLYNDFRNVANQETYVVENTASCFDIQVFYHYGSNSATITPDSGLVTATPSLVAWIGSDRSTRIVNLCIDANETGDARQFEVVIEYEDGTTRTIYIIQQA